MHGRLRNSYESSSEIRRRVVGGIAALLPAAVRYGPSFARALTQVQRMERAGAAEAEAFQVERLRELLVFAGAKVPHYRDRFRSIDFDPSRVTALSDLECLPILTKQEARRAGLRLSPEGLRSFKYRSVTTGGTSGEPLGLRVAHSASASEWAHMLVQWSRIGFSDSSRRAVLRGVLVPGRDSGRLWSYDRVNRALVFSTFDLSPRTVSPMVAEWRRYGAEFLHAYPSAAALLATLILESGDQVPPLQGVLLGSETVHDWQREHIERVFCAPSFSWYGLTEKVVLAAECEVSRDYHPVATYGVTELVDDSGAAISEPGRTGRIVATGFINRATVLIRYLTDDTGEWAHSLCRCGRGVTPLRNVTGHREQEYLVAGDGSLIPMTALHGLHCAAYASLRRFQFAQDTPGRATLRLVPGSMCSDSDIRSLTAELEARLHGRIELSVDIVDSLELTSRGKFRFVDQQLAIPEPTQSGVSTHASQVGEAASGALGAPQGQQECTEGR